MRFREEPAAARSQAAAVSGRAAQSHLKVDAQGFDTPFFSGRFDDALRITSLVDKRNRRELCRLGEALDRIVCYETARTTTMRGTSISITIKSSGDITDLASMEIVSEGPVFTRLRAHYRFNQSTIDQDVTFYADLDRVDFDTTVDWKEQRYMLKAHFPVDVFYNEASFDIQYGNVRRATHKNPVGT